MGRGRHRRPRHAAPATDGPVVDLTIERVALGTGDAVAHLDDGRVVFVDRGLPGDRVRARLTQQKKRFARAQRVAHLDDGPDRVAAECAVADRCGGCRYQSYAFAAEHRDKRAALAATVRRIDRDVTWPEPELVPDASPSRWRERAKVHAGPDGFGFRQRRGDGVVAPKSCPVLDARVDAARRVAGRAFADLGDVSLLLELDRVRDAVACTVRVPDDRFEATTEALGAQLGDDDALAPIGTVRVASRRRSAVVRGDGVVVRERPMGPRSVAVNEPTGGFSQANGRMNAVLQALVVDATTAGDPGAAPRVLELLAGGGNLSFPLLGAGCAVDAVEGASGAIDAARDAWRWAGGGDAARFFVADLAHGLPVEVEVSLPTYDAIVVDPPRGGLAEPLIAPLCASAASRIVYVSCDPPALARDAARLAAAGGFAVARWWALDLFPRSAHIEAVAVLERDRRADR